ncbi:UNVERIFIED_CONTAM: rRNA-processing protein fcf2 [Sesamum angustifolium]|uniref:rRNA-processing protein fcf2 n=1 Tax=Sesamum angustifolium TaxID=2727405 RepID=A0AAW2M8R8_9LAMI
MSENKAVIGLSWQPKLDAFSSTKVEKIASKEAETSALYKPNSQLIDGLFLPPNDPRKLNKLAKKQVKDTAGKNWFDMPAQTITPELKKDLQLLKLRSAVDPKRHYKKGDSRSKALPKKRKVREIEEVNRPAGVDKWKIKKSRKHGRAGKSNGSKKRH